MKFQGGMKQMRKLLILVAGAMLAASFAGNAAADEIRGRFAVTGKIGVTNAADSERNGTEGKLVVSSDAGFIGGGGILFGVDNDVALEIGATSSAYDTSGLGDAEVTTVYVGGQYRFPENQRIVPYVGAGLDILINDLSGNRYTDTVVGGHLAGGIDYFVTRQVAFNAEVKGVQAFSSDVREYGGGKIGEFDPSSVSLTFGARLFFN
jgi:outer membrane protein